MADKRDTRTHHEELLHQLAAQQEELLNEVRELKRFVSGLQNVLDLSADEVVEEVASEGSAGPPAGKMQLNEQLELAKSVIAHERIASTYYLQQRLSIPYADAKTLITKLESEGHIGATNGTKAREIFLNPDDHPVPTVSVEFIAALGSMTDFNDDEYYQLARSIVIEAGQASTSMLQRMLQIGYSRAARLIDALEERGVIGRPNDNGPYEVYPDEDDL